MVDIRSAYGVWLLVLTVAAAAYAGFQLTVHFLVYPQFRSVPPQAFPAFEREHQRRISRVVGPLFGALFLAQTVVWIVRPAAQAWWPLAVTTGLLLIILGATAVRAVPQHRVLTDGWDADAHRALLRADRYRTSASVANVMVLAVLLI